MKTEVKLEEKLYENKFVPDVESHIKTNNDICVLCQGKECTRLCPSNVFSWSKIDDRLIISYESCLECGACKMICPFEVIKYNHPKSGYGYFIADS